MDIRTFNHAESWDHSSEVLSFKTKLTGVPQQEITDVGSFTTDPGDRLLILFDVNNTTSGYKLSSDMSSAGTLPTPGVMQCHTSAHVFQLGDDTNNVKITYNMGSEFKSTAIWIDRATQANSRIALSVLNSNPVAFAGINFNATVTSAGTDASLGQQVFNMKLRGATEHGPVIVLKWAAGEVVPDAAEIDIMLEWLWYRWSTASHHVLYPPMRIYS